LRPFRGGKDDAPRSWQTVTVSTDGCLDLGALFPPAGPGSAYAFRLDLWLSAEPADRARALGDRGRLEEALALVEDARARQPDQAALVCLKAHLLCPSDHWQVLEPLTLASASGTTLTKQPDGSILASGKNPLPETYTITCKTKLTGITGVRLELLTDPSLPAYGPGAERQLPSDGAPRHRGARHSSNDRRAFGPAQGLGRLLPGPLSGGRCHRWGPGDGLGRPTAHGAAPRGCI
jgi:hypothetical protein